MLPFSLFPLTIVRRERTAQKIAHAYELGKAWGLGDPIRDSLHWARLQAGLHEVERMMDDVRGWPVDKT